MRTSQARDNYQQLHDQFRWLVPDSFNIAEVCARRWAKAPDATKRVAVYADGAGVEPRFHTYAELQHQANRLSGALASLRVGRGDRVAIVLPQRFETAVAYMAVLQMGAVAVPLSQLFGPEALEYRLKDSDAAVVICDSSAIMNILEVRGTCEALRHVIGVGAGADAMADLATSQREQDRLHQQLREHDRQHAEDQNRIDALMDVARPHLAKGKHGDTARSAAPFGLPVIPKDWIGLLKLTLLDDNAKLVLKIDSEGGGAYARLKADAVLDGGSADFLPGVMDGLIGLMDYLFPHLAVSHPDHFADTGNMVGSEARP